MAGQALGHEASGSQVSRPSMEPLPHTTAQSLSLAALQPLGQQPSSDRHWVSCPASMQWAVQVPASTRVSSVQPCIGQVCGQVVSGSHSSPGSSVPLPHWLVQSRSLAAVQPSGQHSSPSTQVDCWPAETQTAAQVPSLYSRCI
jgi:hypothetical protein